MIHNPNEHLSATESHYDKEALYYDAFNELFSEKTNKSIEKILHQYDVKTVLDLCCGTGSQVFWLAERGYEVFGVDINTNMLEIAQSKAQENKLSVTLGQGDMRSSKMGEFDAVLTIFNAIGHLTKVDFEKAIQNIHSNLKTSGLYIFDIFNLNNLLHEDNITKLTIDWQKQSGDLILREIQYSTINQEGILASYDIYHEQKGSFPPKITSSFQTLQVYTAQQLREILTRNGFAIIQESGIDGANFEEQQTERILTVAVKL